MFTPSRLTLARKRRGMTKRELASAIGITDRSIVGHEAGETEPSPRVVALLSHVLGFPRDFFFAEEVLIPDPEGANFRALTSMTAKQRDAALSAGALAIELARWISERFELPPLDVPDLPGADPETAAETVRAAWALGERPIRSMIHQLESRGVRVFSLVEDAHEVDAFSMWRGEVPYIFLNTQKSAERSRFDAAHELGHLVMHRKEAPDGRRAEVEAQRFASAFLMPRGSVSAITGGIATVERLIVLKRNWNVSVAALAHRLSELRHLTEWQYRVLSVQLQQLGYRKREPNAITRESSKLLELVFESLRSDRVGKGDVARELHVNTDEVEALVFGLVLLPLPGGTPGQRVGSRERTDLRLVKGQVR